jgi:hypothetical protein
VAFEPASSISRFVNRWIPLILNSLSTDKRLDTSILSILSVRRASLSLATAEVLAKAQQAYDGLAAPLEAVSSEIREIHQSTRQSARNRLN